MTQAKRDALSAVQSWCTACVEPVDLDVLTSEGLDNQLRGHGIDPEALAEGTPEQIAKWRHDLGFCYVNGGIGEQYFDVRYTGPSRFFGSVGVGDAGGSRPKLDGGQDPGHVAGSRKRARGKR